jgi:hypothetical protein
MSVSSQHFSTGVRGEKSREKDTDLQGEVFKESSKEKQMRSNKC